MTEQNPVQIDPDLSNVTSNPRFTKKTVIVGVAASAALIGIGVLIASRGREVAEAAQEIVHETAVDVADATK